MQKSIWHFSEDNETLDRQKESNEYEICKTKELAVAENSRKEEEELKWCNEDTVTQETLDKIISKMH